MRRYGDTYNIYSADAEQIQGSRTGLSTRHGTTDGGLVAIGKIRAGRWNEL